MPRVAPVRPEELSALKKILAIVAGALVVLVGIGVAVWFLFLKTDPKAKPVEVATPTAETSAGAAASPDGTWKIVAGTDQATGDDAETFVGYRVEEVLFGINQTATGRTPDVTGSLTVSGTTVSKVSITADLTTLTSDKDMRDNAIRDDGLQTSKFPEATFTLTTPITLSAAPTLGTSVQADAQGDLTLHGVTKPVTVSLEARWDGTNIHVFGTLPVNFLDYDITAPSRPQISVEDKGAMDVNLWFGPS